MPQYIDSYYLIDNRNHNLIYKFMAEYLPNNEESADEYPVPQLSDKHIRVFYNVNDLIIYLEHEKRCEYSIYWQNLDANSLIKHFMVFFTDDGKMIFGISIIGSQPSEEYSITLFHKIKKHLNSTIGCITVEEPPPYNSIEFIEFAKKRFVPG